MIPCSATTRSGRPCRGRAIRDTDPPLCSAHGGAASSPGAPKGNVNAQTHGAYTVPKTPNLAARISDLDDQIQSLDTYIESKQMKDISADELATLLNLYGQLVSRLGRLMRDQRALSGEAADGISGAIAQALDELSSILGIDL
jgi:hypothetical protein